VSRVRVAVLMGGRSSEHDVSLASARSVVEALDPARYETVAVEIGRDGHWEIGPATRAALERGGETDIESLPVPTSKVPATLAEVDVVFPLLHGPFGEDGTVQGFLDLADVPYVGAGVMASALCMDKDLFKSVLRDKGIPVAESVTIRSKADARAKPARPETGIASDDLRSHLPRQLRSRRGTSCEPVRSRAGSWRRPRARRGRFRARSPAAPRPAP
jgi:D-alanine-D-alanine ligase